MSFSTLVSDAWFVLRKHYLSMFLLFLPSLLFSLLLSSNLEVDPEQLMQLEVPTSFWLWMLGNLLISFWAQLAIYRYVWDQVKDQPQSSLVGYYARSLSILPILVLSMMLVSVMVGLGLMLFIIPGLYLFFRFWLVMPVIALEDTNPLAAIARSWKLTSGNGLLFMALWGAIIGFFVISGIIEGLLAQLGVPLFTLLFSSLTSLIFALMYLLISLRVYDAQLDQ